MKRTHIATAALAAFAAVGAYSSDASACGGFFCDGSGPTAVNQAAERIVFAQHPDGAVTSVIQIMYEGPADQFGWLLPVPGVPEFGLSSDAAFTALQTATNPQYTMTTTVEGDCRQDDRQDAGVSFGNDGAQNNGSSTNNGAPNEGVVVLARGAAGPYDYVVIQVDAAVDNNVQLALDWLEANNYEVTNAGPDLIKPYLDDGYNLLAIRLQKTADAGSVRPVRLKYDTDHPMIPIKLTAVAANDDMGVMTWILGEERAVPVNYKALTLNDSLINWFNANSTYNDVVIAAANEASGQGFVTEYAQNVSDLGKIMYTDSDEQRWTELSTTDWTGKEDALLNRVIDNYVFSRFDNFGQAIPWDGLPDAIDAVFPNLTEQQRVDILSCGTCAFAEGELPTFVPADLVTAIEDFVDAPMRETQELVDEFKFVTRMYTTLSAHEMTLDPSFDYNPDLPAVTNVHTAERIIECDDTVYQWEAPWRVELPSGLQVRGTGSTWPVTADDGMMPATLTVSEVGTSGSGEVVRDNFETVTQQLELINAKSPPTVGGSKAGGGGGGCSTTPGNGAAPLSLLALGLVALGRRRRQ